MSFSVPDYDVYVLHENSVISNYLQLSAGNCRRLPVSVKRRELTYLSNNLHGSNREKYRLYQIK